MTMLPEDADAGLLSGGKLARFSDFLARKTGMCFGQSKRYYIEHRIAGRMRALGAGTFDDYFAYLRGTPGELEILINLFTVNETYFYREINHFSCLSGTLLPGLAARRQPGDKIRIWVLPCSTGEEAYSVAIWLLENWAMVDAYHIEIVASDIDTDVLAQAVLGHYAERALSRLPPGIVAQYFEPERDGRWRIIKDLRESVRFTPANLIDTRTLAPHGKFDVILCRNVLIYFDDATRAAALGNLHGCLLDGGYLILGHTESMGRVCHGFTARRCGEVVVYQKRGTER